MPNKHLLLKKMFAVTSIVSIFLSSLSYLVLVRVLVCFSGEETKVAEVLLLEGDPNLIPESPLFVYCVTSSIVVLMCHNLYDLLILHYI
jgi:hypothetical protein